MSSIKARGSSKEIDPINTATKRPLKRSASLASLPTPPRTRRNPHSRSQSRGSVESDSDSGSEHSFKDDKRRRLSKELDEDEFWLDSEDKDKSTQADKGKDKETEREQTRSPSPDYTVSKRLSRSTSAEASLASPPPSRRHPPAPVKTLAPVTPQRPTTRSQTKKAVVTPLLDNSLDNPFVDTPGKDDKEDELPTFDLDKLPSPAEKPTVTYVFRGKRAQFANPHYIPPNETPVTKAKREHKYNLPLDHPDYSPDPRCPPKRLFFSKVTKKTTTTTVKGESSKASVKKMLSTIHSDDEVDDSEEEEDLFAGDIKGIAKKLFVQGAGKGSVDAGMVKADVLIKRGQPSATDDD